MGVTVRWLPFPLHPDTPEEGLALEKLFARYPVDMGQMMERLRKTAEDLGLPFGDRKNTYNSRLAQELGLWAESKDKGDAFHNAAFRAYFVDGKNIAKVDVLLDLARSVDLSPEEAEDVLSRRSFSDVVDAEWLRSRKMGITAVPTFLMGQGRLVGAQPYPVLEKFVKANGAGSDFF